MADHPAFPEFVVRLPVVADRRGDGSDFGMGRADDNRFPGGLRFTPRLGDGGGPVGIGNLMDRPGLVEHVEAEKMIFA